MTTTQSWKILEPDLTILRALARRVREIADLPVQAERRDLWKRLNSLSAARPMILLEHQGIRGELGIDDGARCTQPWAREVESTLLHAIWRFENVGDDLAVEHFYNVRWKVDVSDYGVAAIYQHGNNEGRLGSYHWDAPIKDIDRDFHLLRPRTWSVDREATLAWRRHLQEVLGDALEVRIRGAFWWTTGLTWEAIKLVGLEGLMLLMYDNPAGLHRLMKFLRDDTLAFARWLESERLLTLNNENDYVGSGSAGYTDELPAPGYRAGSPARMRDMWVLSESQETVGVGPDLFEEFIFPYQLSILEHFGLSYYGCCEPVHSRWHVLKRFGNLRKVSVSPWADETFMAQACGRQYVFCRKPNPALISTERFDEDAIRADLRATLDKTRGVNLEIVMKDVHTVSGHPERLGRWVEIAREEIDRRP